MVSVVIPCLNEAANLPPLLDTLRAQEAPLHEVIVVDNGSTDGSPEVVRDYQRRHADWPLRLLTCAKPGAAAALNVGITAATGDFRLDGKGWASLDGQARVEAVLRREAQPGRRQRVAARHPTGADDILRPAPHRASQRPQRAGCGASRSSGCLRETAGGGLAATPTGRRLAKERLVQIKRSDG